jgi:hypothetical protein
MKISIQFRINLFYRKPVHNSFQLNLAFPDSFKQINPEKRGNTSFLFPGKREPENYTGSGGSKLIFFSGLTGCTPKSNFIAKYIYMK